MLALATYRLLGEITKDKDTSAPPPRAAWGRGIKGEGGIKACRASDSLYVELATQCWLETSIKP